VFIHNRQNIKQHVLASAIINLRSALLSLISAPMSLISAPMSLISAGKNGKNVFISVKSSVANWQARLYIHKWARQGDAVLTGKGLNKFVQHFAFF
jgi:hypothetical protein